jgi:hypothetical protein
MTPEEIRQEYEDAFQACRDEFLGTWVRHKKVKKQATRPSPGKVEAVEMSMRHAVCTVRWADNRVTVECGYDLEVKDRGL